MLFPNLESLVNGMCQNNSRDSCFAFNSSFYIQVSDVAMRVPSSPL